MTNDYGPPRPAVLKAVATLNELIDAPLLERGFDSNLEPRPYEGDVAEVAYVLTRTLKLAEELGELMEAITGRMALNFRKGTTDANWADVSNELNDIAATAVLANAALFNPSDPIANLEAHIMGLARRAQEASDER